MLDNRSTTSTLFSAEVQYKVPHYQRRYVWDKTNWLTLWENILAHLELEIEGDADGKYDLKDLEQCKHTSKEKVKKHFTGIIVIRKISEGPPEIFEVIDGQQRLMTFQIILCVIRDILRSENFTEEAMGPQNLIKYTFSSEKVYYSLIPTDYDYSAFNVIVDGRYGNLISQCDTLDDNALNSIKMQLTPAGSPDAMSQNILDVYKHFYRWVRHYGKKTSDEKLGDLLGAIKSRFNFAILKLGKEDYSEEIFESLNATGTKLSDFDFLRNNLFLRAGAHSEYFYQNYWIFEDSSQNYKFETHFWNTDNQKAFLRAFLVVNLGPYCFKSDNINPLDVYRKYSRTAGGIENEFKQLMEYAKSYQELKKGIDDPSRPIHQYVQLCSDLSLNCLEPLLLFTKHKYGDDVVDHVCKILESYLVRLMFCFGNKQETNDASCKCINYFFDKAIGHDTFDVEEFKQFLSGSGNLKYELDGAGGDAWPDDRKIEETLNQIENKDSYLMCYMYKRLEHYSQAENHTPWEYSPPSLDEHSKILEQMQKSPTLNDFTTLWESPPR